MKDDKPTGAILVVTVLAIVILISWFGMYGIFLGRV